MTLTEFLLARIAEDEATVRHDYVFAMTGTGWHHYPEAAYNELQSRTLKASKRLDAECEAKRRIVALSQVEGTAQFPDYDGGYESGWEDASSDAVSCLAQAYADHPDFDPAWRIS